MKKIIVLASLAKAALLFSHCYGQIDQCQGSLQGIQSIGVIVGDAPQAYTIDFLAQLKTDAEQMLKTAGITIIDLDTISKPEDKKNSLIPADFWK